MKESEIIRGVIELLSSPDSWVKGIRAMKPATSGPGSYSFPGKNFCSPTDPEATMFCLGGAIMHVTQNEDMNWFVGPAVDRFHELARARGYTGGYAPFVEFNNDPTTTHEDMMLFLKEALVDAEVEEAKARIEENLAPVEGAGF